MRHGRPLFGSLEDERQAYIAQKEVERELAVHQGQDLSEIDRALAVLRAGGQPAYRWIYQQGPYYLTFPPEVPKIWQVREWWPQVWYVLGPALHGAATVARVLLGLRR